MNTEKAPQSVLPVLHSIKYSRRFTGVETNVGPQLSTVSDGDGSAPGGGPKPQQFDGLPQSGSNIRSPLPQIQRDGHSYQPVHRERHHLRPARRLGILHSLSH